MRTIPTAAALMLVAGLATLTAPAAAETVAFDFQPAGASVEPGFTAVTPGDTYSADAGFGFTTPPRAATDGSRHTWTIFSRVVTVDQAVPEHAVSNATRDNVSGARPFTFVADVEPGTYDVTVWLGDVTRPTHLVQAVVNGRAIVVERMDVNHARGSFDQTVFGNAVPRTVRVGAPDGRIELTVGPAPSTSAVTWSFVLDECPSEPDQPTVTAVVVPAFSAAGLQALVARPAADPPLSLEDGVLVATETADPALAAAVARYNVGDLEGALAGFRGLAGPSLRVARAAGIAYVAGHPGVIGGEAALLAEARALLEAAVLASPEDGAAHALLLAVRQAADAERYRAALGYGGTPAAENLGRSCAILEQLQPGHPYHRKGQILWLRNRGGLDPRRCSVSFERAQDLARTLAASWGAGNPYVELYAHDTWADDGQPWSLTDWGAVAGEGPEWARTLVRALNLNLDLSEWWVVNRQNEIGEIGGGWTDDVELVGLFGLVGHLLGDAGEVSVRGALKLADGIWASGVIDQEAGFEAAYADVEHSAEPTGDSLHLYPLLRYGDPEGMERILRNAKTFAELFLTTTPSGHRHFKGNHMSATQIGLNPAHRSDIPLNGRAVAPVPWLVWYSGHPAARAALEGWTRSWVEDAARTDKGKPPGVFPNAVVVEPSAEELGAPGGDWYSDAFAAHGIGAFPKYQYFLYNLAALLALETGDAAFLAPFDAAAAYGLQWDATGRPALGDAPAPGQEALWCGGKLLGPVRGTLASLAAAGDIERPDWNAYLDAFAWSYARYRLDPTDAAPLADVVEPVADTLEATWPYRTTEGVMTDRIAVVGIGDVVSYYLGADVYSVYFGLPLPTVTWTGTGRLFAAAVAAAGPREVAATLYLFEDAPRAAGVRLWGLEEGAGYRLEVGPAAALGEPAFALAESVDFTYSERGQEVGFTLPGRTVTALRVVRTASGAAAPGLRPDLAVADRDLAWNPTTGVLSVRVHNIGSADAGPFSVVVRHAGVEVARATVAGLAWPADLVPSSLVVELPLGAVAPPFTLECELDPGDAVVEITRLNNRASRVVVGPPRPAERLAR